MLRYYDRATKPFWRYRDAIGDAGVARLRRLLSLNSQPAKVVGNYRIVRKLGEGGMGRRVSRPKTSGSARQVALKNFSSLPYAAS